MTTDLQHFSDPFKWDVFLLGSYGPVSTGFTLSIFQTASCYLVEVVWLGADLVTFKVTRDDPECTGSVDRIF